MSLFGDVVRRVVHQNARLHLVGVVGLQRGLQEGVLLLMAVGMDL